ncbi:MAG: AraC family transcriptional regulator [Deltaproteobacteria bacterium]|nr:AraC family transcriptional regulator [Deltaproteobacteria bacterium]
MTARPTIASSFVEKLMAYGSAHGLVPSEMRAVAGLAPGAVLSPERSVGIASSMSLWEHLMRHLRDEAIPIRVAEQCTLNDYHVLGFAVMSSQTVREAVQRAVRYSGIFTTSGEWRLDEHGDLATVTWTRDMPLTLGHRVANENTLAEFVHGYRQITNDPIVPHHVGLTHPAPSVTRAHEEFFGTRVQFGAAANSLSLERGRLDAPLAGGNPSLASFFDRYVSEVLRTSEEARGTVARVRSAIREELASGRPTSGMVAGRLAIGERSLRRRLQAEGTSFRDLVMEVSHEQAERLLRDTSMSLSQIAFLLGYSDATAFSRAYRRKTGISPREFRRRHLDDARFETERTQSG